MTSLMPCTSNAMEVKGNRASVRHQSSLIDVVLICTLRRYETLARKKERKNFRLLCTWLFINSQQPFRLSVHARKSLCIVKFESFRHSLESIKPNCQPSSHAPWKLTSSPCIQGFLGHNCPPKCTISLRFLFFPSRANELFFGHDGSFSGRSINLFAIKYLALMMAALPCHLCI